MIGLLSYGVYVPRRRLQRSAIFAANGWFNKGLASLAKGERAMANWDEDSITMGVEAARDCLIGRERTAVSSVVLASTTAPFADRQNAGVIKEALNLPDCVGSMDAGGGQRAATSALIQSLKSCRASREQVLCIAAEKRKAPAGSEAEFVNGDGAAAVLVGEGDVIAKYIGSHSVTMDFVDHFRAANRDFDYGWESRWIRDEGYAPIIGQAINSALTALDIAPDSIAHFVAPIPVKGVAAALAKAARIRSEAVSDTLAATIGHCGVAHPAVMLAQALESGKPGERILMLGFGQGCDVLLFEITEHIVRLPGRRGLRGGLARRKAEDNYMKYLYFNDLILIEKGMRAEVDLKQSLSALYRSRKTVLGLVGGRSPHTGAVQYPKTEIGVDPGDPTIGTQEDYPFAERRCRILTHTSDSLTYTLDPPAFYGMVEFDGGGRMVAEFVDLDAADVVVGREMTMMFRIKDTDSVRGFRRYFWKAAPVS
jgi:hydroxymethylglutaryl-CoA synthase